MGRGGAGGAVDSSVRIEGGSSVAPVMTPALGVVGVPPRRQTLSAHLPCSGGPRRTVRHGVGTEASWKVSR